LAFISHPDGRLDHSSSHAVLDSDGPACASSLAVVTVAGTCGSALLEIKVTYLRVVRLELLGELRRRRNLRRLGRRRSVELLDLAHVRVLGLQSQREALRGPNAPPEPA